MKIPQLSTLFKSSSHDAGGFAIGLSAHGVYLARIKLAGAMPSVVRCEYHEIGTVSAVSLEKLRREADFGRHDFTTLLMPDEYQMLLVEAPSVPANELKAAIRWKIKNDLNCHIDDATVDVLQIPANNTISARAQFMYAIAATNDTIQKRIALFEQAKIELTVIDIPEMAQRNIAALFEQAERALVLLAFDDNGSLLTITAGGELYLARRIEISVGQLQDVNETLREQHFGRIELELQRSLDYFEQKYNHLVVSRVLVSAPEESGLVSFLASEIAVTVEQMDLSQVMDISAIPALTDSEFVAHALPTLGAALHH